MGVMFVLLPVALVFAAGALCAFIWAARSGQFDDLVTPGLRILHDDEAAHAREARAADAVAPGRRAPTVSEHADGSRAIGRPRGNAGAAGAGAWREAH
jgi:cbb3-type cytochrome oxidase maturation protein